MKLHSQLLCRLSYAAFLMGMLAGGLSLGQEIESTEVDGDSLRVRIRAPQIELERINPDGSSTTEAASSDLSLIHISEPTRPY